MIAACPKCTARYRIERERLEAGAVRLRCARCEAVFRVRPPLVESRAVVPPAPRTQAAPEPIRAPAPQVIPTSAPPPPPAVPAPAPRSGELVLIAMSDASLAKRIAELLGERGCAVLRATDGVEAMLEIQRKLPRAVVLAADLPKMFGFQICEIVKRNPSLRGTFLVLVGAIHHPDRYRREAADLYGADAYLEAAELPERLVPLLAQGGLALGAAKRAPAPPPAAAAEPARPEPARPAPARPEPAPAPLRPAPAAPSAPPRAAPKASAPAPVPAPQTAAPAPPRPPRNDGLDPERAKAERLARIVVSDIVLYNEERFTAAARAGNVFTAMAGDLAEGRALFEERIDPRVRAERDHLKEELLRSAKLRGMR